MPAGGRRPVGIIAVAATILVLGGVAVGLAFFGPRDWRGSVPTDHGGQAPEKRPGPEVKPPGSGAPAKPEPPVALADSGVAVMLGHTGHGQFILAPAGSPDCMCRGALVQRDKTGVFVEIPGEMEGQARTFGPWYGQGPADELFRIKVLRPCTIYMLGGSGTGGADWKARGWTHSGARVLVGAPAGTKREALDVWRLEAEPGELKLARDRHNYMMNFVFVPGSGDRK